MFKYIFGISWEEYTKTYFDKNNAIFYVISFSISILLFGWWGIPIWIIFLACVVSGGGAWIIK